MSVQNCRTSIIFLTLGEKLTKCMYLVNLAKSSKSILEFLFLPVITVFFNQKSREGQFPPPPPCLHQKGGGGKKIARGGGCGEPWLFTGLSITIVAMLQPMAMGLRSQLGRPSSVPFPSPPSTFQISQITNLEMSK